MGDPAGIGAEVIAKALTVPAVRAQAHVAVYGDAGAMAEALAAGTLKAQVVPIERAEQARNLESTDAIPVLPISALDRAGYGPGKPSLESDRAQLAYIEQAVADVRAKKADAVVTAPISKASIARAGATWPGHTELLAARCEDPTLRPVMMLAGERLKVVPLTVHIALRDVPAHLDRQLVLHGIRTTHAAFARYFGKQRPRIAVAGLNPHASEGGLFGHEEAAVIGPAVEAAQGEGILVRGPFPADTVYRRALEGEFDAVIGMYHDQALIPIKLLDFDSAVNVTLGLPIIRTSVDHGTAYDIAGKGVASAGSMIAALRLAAAMVRGSAEPRP
jgi:4-hydroxythreonine-4-phosphate dehydrogenase